MALSAKVKTPDQISAVDGLIVPGGESTMMGQLFYGKRSNERS